MTSLAVFVTGGGAVSGQVKHLVESWTRAGILGPSLWVAAERVVVQPSGPPIVVADHLHATGTDEVDLFEFIGRFRVDIVRIVVGHLIVDGEADHTRLLEAASLISRSIQASLPMRIQDQATGGTRLHRSLVILPATGSTGEPPVLIDPEWDVNVVISPEDRPDLDRASIFVRSPGNFNGHAACALSAIGGIVRGVDQGALDDVGLDSATRSADFLVARISVRSIIGEDTIGSLTARATAEEFIGAEGPASALPWARAAAQPEILATTAAETILTSDEWAPTPPPPASRMRERSQTTGAAIRTALAFNLRTVGAVASWTLTRGRVGVEAGLTRAVVGEDAGTLVTLGPQLPETIAAASSALLARERTRVTANMDLEAARVIAPPATTWTRLRALAFSLTDGGPLDNFPEPRQAGKRELLPANSVVVEPGDKWLGRDGSIGADDPRAAHEYRARLAELLSNANVAVAEADLALKTARKAAEDAGGEQPSADADDQGDASDQTETPVAVDPTTPTAEAQAVQRAEEALARATAERDEIGDESQRFAAWFERCASSMLWKVGDDVARRQHELEAKWAQLRERRDEEAPPAEALKVARKTLIRWWKWTTPIWLVVTALLVWLRYGDLSPATEQYRLTTEGLIYSAGAVLLVTVLILGLANHAFYKAMRAYEHAVDVRLDRIAADKDAYVYTGREIARLSMLSTSLKDWTGVIGETVWRPWTTVDEKFEDLPADVIDALPAAMGVARPATGDETITAGVVRETVNALYTEGWAHRNFEIGYARWESEHSLESDDGFRAVDVDVRDSESSPRRLLREFWADDSARAAVTDAAVARVRTAVEDGEITLPARVVSRIGRFGDGTIEPERAFYDVLATESTAFAIDLFVPTAQHSRLHYVDRSIAWLPAGVAEDRELGHIELRQSNGTTAVRVDISRRLSARELVTFEHAAPPAVATPVLRESAGQQYSAAAPPADDSQPDSWH